eukprot:SAG25_NODE_1_length_41698_cov_149.842015_5_plen_97_part_00
MRDREPCVHCRCHASEHEVVEWLQALSPELSELGELLIEAATNVRSVGKTPNVETNSSGVCLSHVSRQAGPLLWSDQCPTHSAREAPALACGGCHV